MSRIIRKKERNKEGKKEINGMIRKKERKKVINGMIRNKERKE